jgi:hypothetical protein
MRVQAWHLIKNTKPFMYPIVDGVHLLNSFVMILVKMHPSRPRGVGQWVTECVVKAVRDVKSPV